MSSPSTEQWEQGFFKDKISTQGQENILGENWGIYTEEKGKHMTESTLKN